ncbi:MAG: HK97 family phage prohead protease [Rikenellaceae bacterium]
MIKNNEIEVRCLATELRANPTEGRTISGYAAKFDSWSEPIMGWFKEKIDRSAFTDCDVTDVIMCFNHNPDTILARTTSDTLTLSTDDVGLRFSFTAPNTTLGNDMLELVSRGDISQCSFRFIVEQDEWRYADKDNGLEYDERTILKFSILKDVSLVVFPAYKDTEASVRHLEERKAEHIKLHQVGAKIDKPIDTTHRTRTTQFLSLKN